MHRTGRHIAVMPVLQTVSRPPRPRPGFEQLEPRLLLDAQGVLSGADMHLTLSFAPDGAEIAGQDNALTATFDALAAATNPADPTAAWQATILRAFQTWAVETNADIGVVSDGGQPFGVAGPTQRDARFGDIRIGAMAMEPTVGAVSVPTDGLVAGTWYADVVFNTAFPFRSLDDLYAVALHEAGNVFGLKDNTDPASPLSTSDPPVVKSPTPADIAALQGLFGARAADANETSGGATPDNDSFANATELKRGELPEHDSGSAPTVLYGDITTSGDVDFFMIRGPGGYSGPMTVSVRTAGISLLASRLQVYDSGQQLIGEAVATDLGGGVAEYRVPAVAPGDDYYFRVSAAATGDFDRGGFSLAVVFDDRNVIDQATIDDVAGGAYRFLSAEDMAKLFDGDAYDDELFGDDMHGDDEPGGALELETVPGFVEDTRFQVVASIADATDVDYYTIKSPDFAATGLDVLTATVRSLDAGGLVPKVRLLDEYGNEIAATILANGNGEFILQSTAVLSEDDVQIEVSAADPGGLFDAGNYELIVAFGPTATEVTSLATATIGAGVAHRAHKLYVSEPQLFHFALQADPVATPPPTVLIASVIADKTQEIAFQIATRPGETRTGAAVLLAPGIYTVDIAAATLDGSPLPEFGYSISGTSISDPFVGDPTDPTSNPFACTEPELAGFFCYPGDPPIISPDPFLWDRFGESLPDPPPGLDLPTLINLLLGDWWQWVWNEFGLNGPVLATNDAFHAPDASSGQTFSVDGATGVLGNDVDPEGGAMATILVTDASHGTLSLAADGGFQYTPDPGFTGMDHFTYQVTDFVNVSNVGVAKIVVGDSGDFDAGGSVTGADFLALQRGFGATTGATFAEGDADFDGAVTDADLSIWQQQFGNALVAAVVPADSDGSGTVAGADFLIWQRGAGTTVGATAASGDFTGDGAVDAADLLQWTTQYGAAVASSLAASATVSATAMVQSSAATSGGLVVASRSLFSPEQLVPQAVHVAADAVGSPTPATAAVRRERSPAPPRTSLVAAGSVPSQDHSSAATTATGNLRRHDSRDAAFAAWDSIDSLTSGNAWGDGLRAWRLPAARR